MLCIKKINRKSDTLRISVDTSEVLNMYLAAVKTAHPSSVNTVQNACLFLITVFFPITAYATPSVDFKWLYICYKDFYTFQNVLGKCFHFIRIIILFTKFNWVNVYF